MSVYVRYKRQAIKIGITTELYYTSFRKYMQELIKGTLEMEPYNKSPEYYVMANTGFQFRFPYPDEDSLPLGNIGEHSFFRTISIEIERNGFFKASDFPAIQRGNPNMIGRTVELEIAFQKLIHNVTYSVLHLATAVRCPYSGVCHVLEQPAAEYIARRLVEGAAVSGPDDLSTDILLEIAHRIVRGYNLQVK